MSDEFKKMQKEAFMAFYNVKNLAFSWMNWEETCKSSAGIAEIQTW